MIELMAVELTDEELLRLNADADAPNRAFMQIYYRYREPVLAALEAGGLTHFEAMVRLGAVFIRALDLEPGSRLGRPLREHLLATAAAVVAAHREDEMMSEEKVTPPVHELAEDMLRLADKIFYDLPPNERLVAVGEFIASVGRIYTARNSGTMPGWLTFLIGQGSY
jgi:hypothetical protein